MGELRLSQIKNTASAFLYYGVMFVYGLTYGGIALSLLYYATVFYLRYLGFEV